MFCGACVYGMLVLALLLVGSCCAFDCIVCYLLGLPLIVRFALVFGGLWPWLVWLVFVCFVSYYAIALVVWLDVLFVVLVF